MAQGIYTDIYVLTDDRSVKVVDAFLNHFMPRRKETADEYEIPQYALKPTKIVQSASQLMNYCQRYPQTEHTIYWSSLADQDPKNAIVQYTTDGACVLGLSINDPKLEEKFLQRLKKFTGSRYGYMAPESPPPLSKKEFLEKVNKQD